MVGAKLASHHYLVPIPAGICPLRGNNRNTRTRSGICSKLIFSVNFEYISHLVLVFLLLTLNM